MEHSIKFKNEMRYNFGYESGVFSFKRGWIYYGIYSINKLLQGIHPDKIWAAGFKRGYYDQKRN